MRRRATTARAILGVAALAALLVSCDKSGSAGDPPIGTQLLDHLSPAAQPAVVYLDLKAARKALGIGDLDPRGIAVADPAQRRYTALYGIAFPLLARPTRLPLMNMFDFGKATAVANNGPGSGKHQVTVFATDQSFDEFAAKLVAAGYQRDGSVLHQEDPARSLGASTVAGGPGIIAVGDDLDAVRAAAQGGAQGIHGPVRDLVDGLGAPAIVATETSAACPTAIAITDDLAGNRGRLAVVEDAPSADRVTADDPTNKAFQGKRFDQPTIDHKRLTVSFTYSPDTSPRPLEILPEASVRDLYFCGD